MLFFPWPLVFDIQVLFASCSFNSTQMMSKNMIIGSIRSLAKALLGQTAELYGIDEVTPVCPSTTRWTAHDRALSAFITGKGSCYVIIK